MPDIVQTEILRGGDKWSRILTRGQALRLTDCSGRGSVAALFFNARQLTERYNMPDTLKAQYTAFLTTGRVLYSDMGRILASVTADTCGWHDTLSGHQDAAESQSRFGVGSYQDLRNDAYRNSRDNFLIELGKFGLGRRDLHANVNFFVKVACDDAGRMAWVPNHSRIGASVELRFEMEVLCILSNTPHPLDPATSYAPGAVELSILRVPPAAADDACRMSRPENLRGFQLTEAYAC
jgi:urea carboxylase-associated protein 2